MTRDDLTNRKELMEDENHSKAAFLGGFLNS